MNAICCRIRVACHISVRTPPTLSIVRVEAGVAGALLEVLLSEPGLQVCCAAVLDNHPALSGAEILRVGSFGQASVGGDVATVRLEGLLQDTEYDAYCVGKDLAGNWGSDLSILQSKRDFHVLRDLTPPQLLATEPTSGSTMSCLGSKSLTLRRGSEVSPACIHVFYILYTCIHTYYIYPHICIHIFIITFIHVRMYRDRCAPDGAAAGCLVPPLVLRFNEDQRVLGGTRNPCILCI